MNLADAKRVLLADPRCEHAVVPTLTQADRDELLAWRNGPEFADAYYADDRDLEAADMASHHSHLAAWLTQTNVIKSGDAVLDAGCGNGSLLCLLRDRLRVLQPFGVEQSLVGARIASARGVPTECCDLLSFSPPWAFDVVLLVHVLEHLADPAAIIAHLAAITSQSLVVVVPDGEVDTFAGHVHRFTPATLAALAPAFCRGKHLDRCSVAHHVVDGALAAVFS